jgi:hypothetical protein
MIYGHEGPSHGGKYTDAVMPEIAADKGGAWVEKAGEPLRFKTVGQPVAMDLKPLYQVLDERYTIYWHVNGKA